MAYTVAYTVNTLAAYKVWLPLLNESQTRPVNTMPCHKVYLHIQISVSLVHIASLLLAESNMEWKTDCRFYTVSGDFNDAIETQIY